MANKNLHPEDGDSFIWEVDSVFLELFGALVSCQHRLWCFFESAQ